MPAARWRIWTRGFCVREACSVGDSSVSCQCRRSHRQRLLLGAQRKARTRERNLPSKHDQSFSKLLFLYSQLSSLRLHAPPWHNKANALPTDVHGLPILKLGGGLDDVGLAVLLSLRSACIILVVLKREVEVVLVACVAEILPNAYCYASAPCCKHFRGLLTNEGFGGEYLLCRHVGACGGIPFTSQIVVLYV
jgi:hypothetical protein